MRAQRCVRKSSEKIGGMCLDGEGGIQETLRFTIVLSNLMKFEEGEKPPETVSKIGALAQETCVIVVFGAHPQKCNSASIGRFSCLS